MAFALASLWASARTRSSGSTHRSRQVSQPGSCWARTPSQPTAQVGRRWGPRSANSWVWWHSDLLLITAGLCGPLNPAIRANHGHQQSRIKAFGWLSEPPARQLSACKTVRW